ncbi:MAG: ATP-binding protein [Bacteroidaceae bacterium]|nr:ATP-binding protein [Bacteroidaceae bacterium]
MIERDLKGKIVDLAAKYPIVTLTGPRQSGKSTLLRYAFPEYQYLSMEDPDIRAFATEDPRGFLSSYPRKTIIDEARRVPQLFSYLQTHVDEQNETGVYLIAGSHNFLLMEQVSQTLAGRTAVLKLLPFSHAEMRAAGILPQNINEEIFFGSYPGIFDKAIDPIDFYPFYIQTYVERDVRMIKNIENLSLFIRFVKLCAGRIGQLLNLSSLANECGISVPTVSSWLSILEASYICYLLQPDWNNFSKRLVKTPKLYFYDTGLACSLLDIKSPSQVDTHFLRGGLFENMVINSFVKQAWNRGETIDLRFWRDSQGNEVDLLIFDGEHPTAYEIKSGSTFSSDYFKGLLKWSALSGAKPAQLNVVYGGENSMQTSTGRLLSWCQM